MGEAHRTQRAFDLVLPDEGFENTAIIGHPETEFRSRQPIALQYPFGLGSNHAKLLSSDT
jgi:hypothetical protein